MGAGEPDALNLFVIAGEESGDRLGAPLMAAIAAQAGRPVVFTGVGGREMAEQGLESLVPIADLAVNGFAGDPGAAADHPAASANGEPRRHRRATRRARHHRQSRFHPPGGAARARGGTLDPDHRLRLADGVGVATGTGESDAALCRPRAGAACRSSPRLHQRLGGPPCTYVGHPLIEQLATLRPDRDEAARREARPAARARAAGEPSRRGAAAHRRVRRGDGGGGARGRRRSSSCCRRSRIFSTR